MLFRFHVYFFLGHVQAWSGLHSIFNLFPLNIPVHLRERPLQGARTHHFPASDVCVCAMPAEANECKLCHVNMRVLSCERSPINPQGQRRV